MKSTTLCVVLATLCIAAGLFTSAPARSGDDSFAKRINETGQPTTLKEFASRVQSQSGVTVRYPAHLANRRLCVAVDNQNVSRTLDAICQVEGWTWRTSDAPSTAIIDGPKPGAQPGDTYFAALRRITPPDLSNYLKMPLPSKYVLGSSDPGQMEDRRSDLSRRLSAALSSSETKLVGKGLPLSELKRGDLDLAVLALMISPAIQQATSDVMSNSDWQLAQPQRTRLRLEKGTILMIDCDLGEGHGVSSFGANTERRP